MTTQRKAVPVRVLCIIDGDTVEVDQPAHRGWLKVRLLGIDAPEMDQPGGWDATLKLQELLTGDDDIMLETVAFDRYGRAVGLLYWRDRGRSQSVNLGMVHSGHAFCSTYDRGRATLERMGFYAAERNARQNRRGVWAGGDNPMRPWEHRRQGRVEHPAPDSEPIVGRALVVGAVIVLLLIFVALAFAVE